jgi:hypothetical protein
VEKIEFAGIRKRLAKTQKELAQLLGISLKAIHSYEQGWRNVPAHVERQLFFLISMKQGRDKNRKPCWQVRKCAPEQKKSCPAWEFKIGHLCWFINGTSCYGTIRESWREKMALCRTCEVFKYLL